MSTTSPSPAKRPIIRRVRAIARGILIRSSRAKSRVPRVTHLDFRAVAIERIGITADRIALATVETAALPLVHFDFISFGAVLEHLHSPSLAIERALDWLKPGGVIQLEVPSSRHLVPRALNLYYRLRGTNFVTNTSPMHSPFHL